jgi:hypothetical protein
MDAYRFFLILAIAKAAAVEASMPEAQARCEKRSWEALQHIIHLYVRGFARLQYRVEKFD